MKKHIKVMLFSLLSLVFPVSAQAEESYCGSGLTKIFVPDEFMGCKFAMACKDHDTCYGLCDKDGERHGSSYCNLPEYSAERTLAKQQCDQQLEEKINLINQDSSKCRKFAAFYRSAVKFAGQGPFNGMKAQELITKIIETSENETEVTEKVKTITHLSNSGVIDPLRANLSLKDKVSFNVTGDVPASKLVKDRHLTLKKGLDIRELQKLMVKP